MIVGLIPSYHSPDATAASESMSPEGRLPWDGVRMWGWEGQGPLSPTDPHPRPLSGGRLALTF